MPTLEITRDHATLDGEEIKIPEDLTKGKNYEVKAKKIKGDIEKQLETIYFEGKDHKPVYRTILKDGEKEENISAQTFPRLVFQVFQDKICELSDEERKKFPVCYNVRKRKESIIYGIHKEGINGDQNTMTYKCVSDNALAFYFKYSGNIFLEIVLAQECLKRWGEPGDKFVVELVEKEDAAVEADDNEESLSEWFPKKREYDPGLSVDEWVDLIKDKDVFTEDSLKVVYRMKDYGGQATCKQLAAKYGEKWTYYISHSSHLAQRVIKKTGCPAVPEEISKYSKWWPVLYVGKATDDKKSGVFIWKLRDELSEALDIVGPYPLDPPKNEKQYWWLNANPKIWSFSSIPVGGVQSYTFINKNGNKRKIYQNFLDAKPEDLVIGYESNPVKKIVALGKITTGEGEKRLYFEKTEDLESPIDYLTLKECPELENMQFFANQYGTLFKLTEDEYDFIMDMIRDENPVVPDKPIEKYTKYTKEKFLEDVYMSEDSYDKLLATLKEKKNVILQGAPGVGKTFAAKRLAYSMMGEIDDSRVEFVQFHQNYSYEDFVMGYKPNGDGFELRYGIFYRFCQKAANQPDKDFFFIIDEINRGNMSKIFGELLMLIENDYRGEKTTLAYSGAQFYVPKNLYIIGMMNTADRSLAMIDYALRRRFGFFEMRPAFDSDGFRKYQESLDNAAFNNLIDKIKELNKKISSDSSLGEGFCIGHSYFCNMKPEDVTDEKLGIIVEYEILPMLREYWFDEKTRFEDWEKSLRGVLNGKV